MNVRTAIRELRRVMATDVFALHSTDEDRRNASHELQRRVTAILNAACDPTDFRITTRKTVLEGDRYVWGKTTDTTANYLLHVLMRADANDGDPVGEAAEILTGELDCKYLPLHVWLGNDLVLNYRADQVEFFDDDEYLVVRVRETGYGDNPDATKSITAYHLHVR